MRFWLMLNFLWAKIMYQARTWCTSDHKKLESLIRIFIFLPEWKPVSIEIRYLFFSLMFPSFLLPEAFLWQSMSINYIKRSVSCLTRLVFSTRLAQNNFSSLPYFTYYCYTVVKKSDTCEIFTQMNELFVILETQF